VILIAKWVPRFVINNISQASDSKLNGEIGLDSCAEFQSIVIFPMDGALETTFLSKRSEYFSATGLISSI
jgi:hypothetical protein